MVTEANKSSLERLYFYTVRELNVYSVLCCLNQNTYVIFWGLFQMPVSVSGVLLWLWVVVLCLYPLGAPH